MTKVVHDVVASELDWIRLTERLETERSMSTEMDAMEPEAMTKMEMDLKLSLFREGFFRGFAEVMGHGNLFRPTDKGMHNDGDWAQGYSQGSSIAELALENYRQMMLMGGK